MNSYLALPRVIAMGETAAILFEGRKVVGKRIKERDPENTPSSCDSNDLA